MTGLSYVLQQPSTDGLAKTKADVAKKSSHSYSSHCHECIVCFVKLFWVTINQFRFKKRQKWFNFCQTKCACFSLLSTGLGSTLSSLLEFVGSDWVWKTMPIYSDFFSSKITFHLVITNWESNFSGKHQFLAHTLQIYWLSKIQLFVM